jgi:hypothetical protein
MVMERNKMMKRDMMVQRQEKEEKQGRDSRMCMLLGSAENGTRSW